MFGILSRYSRAIACVRRYSKAPGGTQVCQSGVFGLKRPANERSEAAGLILQPAQAVKRLDALGHGFDVAEHHRAGRTAAQLMPGAVHGSAILRSNIC